MGFGFSLGEVVDSRRGFGVILGFWGSSFVNFMDSLGVMGGS